MKADDVGASPPLRVDGASEEIETATGAAIVRCMNTGARAGAVDATCE